MRVQALFFFIVLLKISSTHGQCPSPLFKEFSDKTFLHYFEPLQKPSLTTGNGVADRVLIGSQEIFSEYGAVKSIKIITDRETGRSRGFGFAEFENREDAEKAITELSGKEIQGRALTINESRPKN